MGVSFQHIENQGMWLFLAFSVEWLTRIHQIFPSSFQSLQTVPKTCLFNISPSPPIDIMWAMMIVWRIRGKIIRTVLCCVVYDSCAQCTYIWAVLTHYCWFRFRFSFSFLVHLFRFSILCVFLAWLGLFCSYVVCFCCVRFSFFSTIRQEIGQEERLRNDLFCVELQINLNSINQSSDLLELSPVCVPGL